MDLAPLLKFSSGLSVLFHWPTGATSVWGPQPSDHCSFNQEVGDRRLRARTTRGPVILHREFRVGFSISATNVTGILIRTVLNLRTALSITVVLLILNILTHECEMPIYLHLNFFQQCSTVFSLQFQSFSPTELNLLLGILILFDTTVHGIVSLISFLDCSFLV